MWDPILRSYPILPQCRVTKTLCEVASSFLSSLLCTLHPALITWSNDSFSSLSCSHTSVLGNSCFYCPFGELLLILQYKSVISSVQPSLTHLPPSGTGSTFPNVPILPVLNLIMALIMLNSICLYVCLPIRLGDPGGQRPFLNYLCILSTWHFAWYLLAFGKSLLHRNP